MMLMSMDDIKMFVAMRVVNYVIKSRTDGCVCAIALRIASFLFFLSANRSANCRCPRARLRCICMMMPVCQHIIKCLSVCMAIQVAKYIASLADIASVAATKHARTTATNNGQPMPSGLRARRCTRAREKATVRPTIRRSHLTSRHADAPGEQTHGDD